MFELCLSPQVNITILDINDNAPVWQDEPYLANVVEMSPINTDVISVSSSSSQLDGWTDRSFVLLSSES